jgi:acyl carrier protein
MGLDVVEIVMDFEETFNISIPDEVAEKLVTVRHAIDYISAHVDQTRWPREQVRTRVREIVINHLSVDPTFSDEASFIDDLGAD